MRQFWSPCSIVRYLDSFSICSTVFRPCPHHSHWCCYRIWWLSPPHWTMLEWPILRQFSSPCSIVRYLDSFQVPARYARYARQFSSPCSICSTVFCPCPHHSHWRSFLSHMMTFPATLDNARVTDIATVFKSLLDSLIPRQFSSPCSICSTVFKSLLDMLDMLDMLDSFWKRPPPLALTFLSHMMTFPATLDNTTPKNINTFRKIYWLKAPRHQSLKNCRTENRPISWLSSEPAIMYYNPMEWSWSTTPKVLIF